MHPVDYGTPVAAPCSPAFPGATAPSTLDNAGAAGPTVGSRVVPTSTVLAQVAMQPTSLLSTLGTLAAKQQDPEAPPHAGDPALFPQSMLDAMTPEQQAQVISTLVKQRAGGIPR